MYILIGESIGRAISDGFRMLMVILSDLIYNLLIFGFNVFERIGGSNLLRDASLQNLFSNISLILGLFMVFRITFSFIQYIMNPDDMLDKNKGMANIIKRVIIAIVLLGSVSSLFNLAYDFQSLIIEKNIIAKVIVGNSKSLESSSETKGGGLIAQSLFTTFLRPREDFEDEYEESYETMKEQLLTGDFSQVYNEINKRENDSNDGEYIYQFDGGGFGSLAVGCVALYIIMIYTIQAGIRLFQLGYLQIISPIPIMMYITPKGEEKLKKWGQQCSTTFIDFFMRSAIMYFIVYIIGIIINDFNDMKSSLSGLWFVGDNHVMKNAYILALLIIAFLAFAKKIPNLLKEIFPSLGGAGSFDYGLKAPKGVETAKGIAKFGAGALVGAAAGMTTGILHGAGTTGGRLGGALTGAARGLAGGAKTKGSMIKNIKGGMANQRAAAQKSYDKNHDGSTFWGRTLGSASAYMDLESFNKEIKLYDEYDSVTKLIDAELEKSANVQAAMAKKDQLMKRGMNGGPAPTATEIEAADKLIKKAKESTLQVKIGQNDQKILSIVGEADAIRQKGVKSGYAGFSEDSLTDGTAAERTAAYFANKDSSGQETRNIKNRSGSRHEAYKQAEANAKYNKTK